MYVLLVVRSDHAVMVIITTFVAQLYNISELQVEKAASEVM